MRLVYVFDAALPSPMAGAVNVTKSCSAFAAEGHRVTLVHFRGRGDIFRHYGLAHRFRALALPLAKRRRGSAHLLAWSAALIARLTGAVVYARKATLLLPAARAGCPVAIELHAPIGPDGHGNPANLAALLATGRVRAIVCISQALAEKIASDWPQAKDLVTVAHDAADAGPAPALPAEPRERPLLGYAGHLYPGKGMEVIAALAERRSDWDFLVLGGQSEDVGRWRQSTKALANVEYTGMLPHSQVAARLASADVLLAPYGNTVIVSDGTTEVARWMSPLKLFEYMALGKPIVAADLPVLREVLSDGDNARLARPDDLDEWERVIADVLADPKAAAAMGERGRAELERKHSWRHRARMIAEALGR